MSIRDKYTRKTGRLFLLILLPLAAVLVSASYYWFYLQKKSEMRIVRSSEQGILQRQEKIIQTIFAGIISDLKSTSAHNEIHNYFEGLPGSREALENEFTALVRYKGIYDQVRLLDTSGRELVRINCNNGRPRAVAADELQDKSRRYYFREAVGLNPGEVYMSPFDLNVEKGEVEAPFKPVIRFGTAVFDGSGRRLGVLIFNYLGADLFRILSQLSSRSRGDFMVLNTDGFWLQSPDPGKEWGFMLEGRSQCRMDNLYPAAWARIEREGEGQFSNDRGLFTFSTIYPLLDSYDWNNDKSINLPGNRYLEKSADFHWKLVSHIPRSRILAKRRDLFSWVLLVDLLFLLVFAALAWPLAATIVSQRKAREELQQREARLQAILNNANEGIISVDAGGRITAANPAVLNIFGYQPRELVGEKVNILMPDSLAAEHDEYIRNFIEKRESRIIGTTREVEGKRKNGELFPLELSVSVLYLREQWIFTGMVRDITERKQMEFRMEKLATTDGLTGLYNRAFFNDRLSVELERARRYRECLSLLILDIDHFKRVNDTYGHPGGDAYLRATAERLKGLTRKVDTVARYGGEEMVVILPCTPAGRAGKLAERLRRDIENMKVEFEGRNIQTTVSIGVASLEEVQSETAEDLLKTADGALYRAKEQGRNRVVFGDVRTGRG